MNEVPGPSEELRTKVFGERAVFENRWVRVTLVDIETPDGQRFEHHVVRLKTVAIAAVLDERDRVLMLWRYRFATEQWGYELLGGLVDEVRSRRGLRRGKRRRSRGGLRWANPRS